MAISGLGLRAQGWVQPRTDAAAAARDDRAARLRREFVRDESGRHGHFRPAREHLLYRNRSWAAGGWRQSTLAWLRDHVHQGIPRAYYRAVLGHDLHLSTFAQLYAEHFHATEPDPFTGATGWRENVGQVSCGKVTTAYRDYQSLNMVTDATAFGDFKFHAVGTSATAEANTDTALITDSGITRVAGNQTNPTAPTYQTVATITADSTETWQEHGVFNIISAGTLLDRSLISPTVAVVNLDTVTFTYVATFTAEA